MSYWIQSVLIALVIRLKLNKLIINSLIIRFSRLTQLIKFNSIQTTLNNNLCLVESRSRLQGRNILDCNIFYDRSSYQVNLGYIFVCRIDNPLLEIILLVILYLLAYLRISSKIRRNLCLWGKNQINSSHPLGLDKTQ